MPIRIIEVVPSERENKRYRITITEDGKLKHYNFGLADGETYIDHADKKKREAYRKRHYGNETEKKLIDNLIPSGSVFSYYLLWGDNTTITDNIIDLQKRFNKKYGK